MALIRWKPIANGWEPFGSLEDIREEMNRVFETSLRRRGNLLETAFAPAIDVIEEKEAFLVKVDLPGLNKDDVNVAIQDNLLTIKGERSVGLQTRSAPFPTPGPEPLRRPRLIKTGDYFD